jgi:hypothetical protein
MTFCSKTRFSKPCDLLLLQEIVSHKSKAGAIPVADVSIHHTIGRVLTSK